MKLECFLHYVYLIYFARRTSELANHKTLRTIFVSSTFLCALLSRTFIITSEAY